MIQGNFNEAIGVCYHVQPAILPCGGKSCLHGVPCPKQHHQHLILLSALCECNQEIAANMACTDTDAVAADAVQLLLQQPPVPMLAAC